MTRSRILVIDDKENMRKLFIRILSDAYDVTTAIDGANAIAQLTTGHFDVVLTDIRMPGADGFEVLRCAKAQCADTEVVMMTAYGSVERAVEAIREGAYDYLTKPFDPDQVVLVLARALEKRRSQGKTRRAPTESDTRRTLRPNASKSASSEPAEPTSGFESLPQQAPTDRAQDAPPEGLVRLPYRQALELARDRTSRDYLVALMAEFGGNVTHAAQHAGIERESLHRLLRRYNVQSDDFKRSP